MKTINGTLGFFAFFVLGERRGLKIQTCIDGQIENWVFSGMAMDAMPDLFSRFNDSTGQNISIFSDPPNGIVFVLPRSTIRLGVANEQSSIEGAFNADH